MKNMQGLSCPDISVGIDSRKSNYELWRGVWRRTLSTFRRWERNRRTRRVLLTMKPYQLKDIGLSRADAVAEAAKPFWR